MIPYWSLKQSLETSAFIAVYFVYAIIIRIIAENFGRDSK